MEPARPVVTPLAASRTPRSPPPEPPPQAQRPPQAQVREVEPVQQALAPQARRALVEVLPVAQAQVRLEEGVVVAAQEAPVVCGRSR